MESRARATVPLFEIDFVSKGRVQLSPDVVLAELNAREAERVRSWHAYSKIGLPAPLFRLEVFFDADQSSEETVAVARVRQALQLLACASSTLPVWFSIPIDRYSEDRGCWVRSSVAHISGGQSVSSAIDRPDVITEFFGRTYWDPAMTWSVSRYELGLWSALLSNWSIPGVEKRVDIALDYFALAVEDLLLDERRAVLSAAIALEAMVGERTELRHRVSERFGHLLKTGNASLQLCERAKRWYDCRSKLVHAGASPEPELTIEFVSHMRAGIPAMLRLIREVGSHDHALSVLDEACFVDPPALLAMHSEPADSWWRLSIESPAG